MNRKVTLCFYSTITGTGYKACQLRILKDQLESNNIKYAFYALDDSIKLLPYRLSDNIIFSGIPLIPNWFYKRFNLRSFYPGYYNYLFGEKLYSWIFKRKILDNDSSIVILKNRPLSLVKNLKKYTNKYIIIEADQQHPFFTRDILIKEYLAYGIGKDSIYTNTHAVEDYANAFKYADLIIVYTKNQKDLLVANGVTSQILINELGLEGKSDSGRIFSSQKQIIYVSFASHSFVKGTHRLIEAWSKLPAAYQLYILGPLDGDIREFIEKNPSLITSNIIFVAEFNKEKLLLLSERFNLVGIALSLSDAYNRVVSEFFELNIPVIVSRIHDREVEKRKFGYIVDAYDTEQIVDAIRKLYNPSQYLEFQRNIQNADFVNHLDFAKKYIEIIESQLNEKHSFRNR